MAGEYFTLVTGGGDTAMELAPLTKPPPKLDHQCSALQEHVCLHPPGSPLNHSPFPRPYWMDGRVLPCIHLAPLEVQYQMRDRSSVWAQLWPREDKSNFFSLTSI